MPNWSEFTISAPNDVILHQAQLHLDGLAKPPGSLGGLESLASRLASIQGQLQPSCARPHIIVFAGDHGVAWEEQVSPYPPQVTAKMVETFLGGRAAVAVLARQASASLEVINCGVVGLGENLRSKSKDIVYTHAPASAQPCGNIVRKSALSLEEQERCFAAGIAAADRARSRAVDVLAIGEMGIGNTTSAAALTAKLLNLPSDDLTGPGTGATGDALRHKKQIVAKAVARVGKLQPLESLRELGGFEINAMTACILRCAELKLPILLDGFIVGAAAVAAIQLNPACRPYMFPATRSAEPGHMAVLEALGIGSTLLQMQLRLGEASGAALALPLMRAACSIMAEMTTLAEVLNGSQ